MDRGVRLTDLDCDRQEEDTVIRVLRSKWIKVGAVIQEFGLKDDGKLGHKWFYYFL